MADGKENDDVTGRLLLTRPSLIPSKFNLPSKRAKALVSETESLGQSLDHILHQALADEFSCIIQPKGGFAKSVCIAEWDDTQNLSVVGTIRGDFQKSFGFMRNQKWCLSIEESLFLVDRGNLEVYHGGVPLSYEQLFSRLVSENRVDRYLVYAFMRRKGFIVRRHVSSKGAISVQESLESPSLRASERPVQASCTGLTLSEALSKLNEIPSHPRDSKSIVRHTDLTNPVDEIDFDIYTNAKTFRATQTSPPDYYLCVMSPSKVSAPVYHQKAIACQDVPVKHAVVDSGVVTLFEMYPLALSQTRKKSKLDGE